MMVRVLLSLDELELLNLILDSMANMSIKPAYVQSKPAVFEALRNRAARAEMRAIPE